MRDIHGETTWFEERTENDVKLFKNITIAIDSRRDNLVSVVLHELLHVYLAKIPEFRRFWIPELEEAIVLGLELYLYNYLKIPKNEKLLDSWSNAIERKFS